MSELLKLAMDAHGGLRRWQQVSRLHVTCSVGGTTWPSDGVLDQTVAVVDTQSQYVSYEPFGRVGQRSTYTPQRVAIVDAGNSVVAESDDPHRLYDTVDDAADWGPLHKAFFAGYAMWTYMSLPFRLAEPGFQVEEMDPWLEGGQAWRRLRAHFPDHIVTHGTLQTFYFGADDFLLRRHDYDVAVLGGQSTSHYCTGFTSFDGLIFPTKRWVVPRNIDDTTLKGPKLVTIDIQSIEADRKGALNND
jgi:nicotinamidase-related amidase